MPSYYDDNFGHYEMECEDEEEVLAFYHAVQDSNRPTVCQGCGGTFMLRPGYGYCNSCADKREKGMDI
jgi:hypothetical protein